jgi:hypothetical protein
MEALPTWPIDGRYSEIGAVLSVIVILPGLEIVIITILAGHCSGIIGWDKFKNVDNNNQ